MGYEEFKNRIQHADTSAQSRIIKRKQQVFKKVVNGSYFSFEVTKPEINDEDTYRVSITGTTSSLGDSEAKKHISSFFEDDFKIGTIVHWLKTDSYWLIYESEKNEIAYFQGKMIEQKQNKCSDSTGV